MKTDQTQFYEQRISDLCNLLSRLQKASSIYSNIRLLIIILGIITGYLLWRINHIYTGIDGLLTITIFIIIANFHDKILLQIKKATIRTTLNKRALSRLQGKWDGHPDNGLEFTKDHSSISHDLDIFGIGSLYQWMVEAHTWWGRKKVAASLSVPPKEALEIRSKQESVKELSSEIEWRQDFSVKALMSPLNGHDAVELSDWLRSTNVSFPVMLKRLRWTPLLIIAIALGVSILTGTYAFLLFWPALNLLIFSFTMKTTNDFLNIFEFHNEKIKNLAELIEFTSKNDFASKEMVRIKIAFKSNSQTCPSKALHLLSRLIAWVGVRHSEMVAGILNSLILYDLQFCLLLENWQKRNGNNVAEALECIGEVEELITLAAINFENPEWAFPVFTDNLCTIETQMMGHPLLSSKSRITNTFTMNKTGSVAVITGSNMSGKSTFLRTVGINLVLGYIGAPVCAQDMKCSIMSIYSSMRTEDNLREGISSFAAEIDRISKIYRNIQQDEQALVLMDELFKGTNSKDRHIAAKAILANFSHFHTLILVSTHDLDLGEWASGQGDNFYNYHFSETYTGDQIRFDYTLNQGVATTTNALFLLRKVGLIN